MDEGGWGGEGAAEVLVVGWAGGVSSLGDEGVGVRLGEEGGGPGDVVEVGDGGVVEVGGTVGGLEVEGRADDAVGGGVEFRVLVVSHCVCVVW